MPRKPFILFIALMGLCSAGCAINTAYAEENAVQVEDKAPRIYKRNFAGNYLSSYVAQTHHDWDAADNYLSKVLNIDPDNQELVKKSMILAAGSGHMNIAFTRAEKLLEYDPSNNLALMLLTVNAFAKDDMVTARLYLGQMPEGDMTDFVKPLLQGWILVSEDKLIEGDTFNTSVLHQYQRALMAHSLGKKDEAIEAMKVLLEANRLNGTEADKVADVLSLLGETTQAIAIYEGILSQDPENREILKKLDAVKNGTIDDVRNAVSIHVTTAEQGAALAMYDMAYMLYVEQSFNSTRIFAQMALALDSSLTSARIVLADMLAREGQFDEAIDQLVNIPEDHPSYIETQRYAAELLAVAGRVEEAKEHLNVLFVKYDDVDSLIRIGDLYREDENYASALKFYNQAASHIGKNIPEEYWHLLYARGIALEREGDWTEAEADLKAALGFRPNHPYLLNYLGYGWADQGLKLEEAEELIKRAAALRPGDGFIIDSLGWVQFMKGDYEEALPQLERAVELLPYDPTINDHLGDAYWTVGRRLEARFQWRRALNHTEDEMLKEVLTDKLDYGLVEGKGLAHMRDDDNSTNP